MEYTCLECKVLATPESLFLCERKHLEDIGTVSMYGPFCWECLEKHCQEEHENEPKYWEN